MSAKKLVLIVVDGMTPAAFERAVESGRAPALALLAEQGTYRRATSVFPSLTPVCLSSIVTGGGPDVHRIPHLVWWDREERRIVEYGSSFAALRAAGMAQSLTDTIFNMNQHHLAKDAVTVYEALEDAGLVTAAVNITCYRGRTRHQATLPWVTKPAFGPKRFFYYSLFESDPTGAPFAVRNRAAGSIDMYAAAVGRWLVTRDGFDFFAYYLSDFDFASHAHGPLGAEDVALARTDAAIMALIDAAGGAGRVLRALRRASCTPITGRRRSREAAQLEGSLAAPRRPHRRHGVEPRGPGLPAARRAESTRRSSRARSTVRSRSTSRCGSRAARPSPGATARSFASARRLPAGRRAATPRSSTSPTRSTAAGRALANPNAGELLVSASPGWEFADLGGRHHAGGGSHGSLVEDDSVVPVLTVGVDAAPARITDVMPAVLSHFGVEPPAYVRSLERVA